MSSVVSANHPSFHWKRIHRFSSMNNLQREIEKDKKKETREAIKTIIKKNKILSGPRTWFMTVWFCFSFASILQSGYVI